MTKWKQLLVALNYFSFSLNNDENDPLIYSTKEINKENGKTASNYCCVNTSSPRNDGAKCLNS